MFTNGQTLHEFCEFASLERVIEIVDAHFLLEEPNKAENNAENESLMSQNKRMLELRIGAACSAKSPSKRMDIKDVILGLTAIKELLLRVEIHGSR